MEVTGNAATTISAGKVVWQNGELKSVRGAGKHVDRPCFAPYFDTARVRREFDAPTPVDRT